MGLAARGARETDGGTESVTDAALAEALRRKARFLFVKGFVATVASAAALYFLAM